MNALAQASRTGTRFDPYQFVTDHGIEIGYLPLESADGLWLPQDNAIVLNMNTIRDDATRRVFLTHMLVHALLENSRTMRRYRRGMDVDLIPFEQHVRDTTATALVSADEMEAALSATKDARELAERFDVNLLCLADRFRAMSRSDHRRFGREASQVLWPAETLVPHFRTCAYGGPVLDNKISASAQLITSLAMSAIAVVAVDVAPFVRDVGIPFTNLTL